MFKEVIVVEGIHDELRLKEIYKDIDTINTNGSDVAESFLETLEKLSLTRDIVLFLDPDSAGERIRRIISNRIPTVKHAFITYDEGISKNRKKVGIEHASVETIKQALDLRKETNIKRSDVTFNYLVDSGLINQPFSKELRLEVCNQLRIGYVNSKGLLKRLHMFSITVKEIEEVLDAIE